MRLRPKPIIRLDPSLLSWVSAPRARRGRHRHLGSALLRRQKEANGIGLLSSPLARGLLDAVNLFPLVDATPVRLRVETDLLRDSSPRVLVLLKSLARLARIFRISGLAVD